MFNHPADFKLPPKEKQAITEFYTTAEIIEKFNVSESWIFVMAKKNKIPKTFNRGKTYWSKKHIDTYFPRRLQMQTLQNGIVCKKFRTNFK